MKGLVKILNRIIEVFNIIAIIALAGMLLLVCSNVLIGCRFSQSCWEQDAE